MSGSAPLVLSCNVRTVDELHLGYSLGLDDPLRPKLPPSRPLSIVRFRKFPSSDAEEDVKALHLETRVADAPALSHLVVRHAPGYMAIVANDADLIVLDWWFPKSESQVYLVYDALEQSIAMIPADPWSLPPAQPGLRCETAVARSVLIARLPSRRRGRYALVRIAETSFYNRYDVEKQDVLAVWRSQRWVLVRAKFPSLIKGDSVTHSYTTVLAFTCGGYAFWANLFRGVMYCSLDALLSPWTFGGKQQLKFEFMNLPDDHPDDPISSAIELYSDMYRTIGRSGKSSIKFVTIHGFVQLKEFVDCTLKVWSLSPDEDMTRWTKRILCLGSLTEQDEFKKAGLPTDMVPMYPSLSAEEDDVVYFMLGEYKKCCRPHKGSRNRCNGYIPDARNPLYHLRVDMRRGVLLASARLPNPTSPDVSIASPSLVPTQ